MSVPVVFVSFPAVMAVTMVVMSVSVFLSVAIAMAATVSMVAVSGRMAWRSHRY